MGARPGAGAVIAACLLGALGSACQAGGVEDNAASHARLSDGRRGDAGDAETLTDALDASLPPPDATADVTVTDTADAVAESGPDASDSSVKDASSESPSDAGMGDARSDACAGRWIEAGCLQPLAYASLPYALVVGPTAVYWVEANNPGHARSVPLAGGAVYTYPGRYDEPQGIALDSTFLYWTAPLGRRSLLRAPLNGGTVTLLAEIGDPGWPAVSGDTVYVSAANGLDTVALGDGGVALFQDAAAAHVAVEGQDLYYTDVSGVEMVDLYTGATTHFASAFAPSLAVSDAGVAWADYFDGSVGVAALDGASPVTISAKQPNVVALDRTHVYWGTQFGSIMRASLDGGSVDELTVDRKCQIKSMGIDDKSLYWGATCSTGDVIVKLTPK